MAGLVPAIHVFFNAKITGGWFYLITNRRNGILYAGGHRQSVPARLRTPSGIDRRFQQALRT
jgi:hypothetical protein